MGFSQSCMIFRLIWPKMKLMWHIRLCCYRNSWWPEAIVSILNSDLSPIYQTNYSSKRNIFDFPCNMIFWVATVTCSSNAVEYLLYIRCEQLENSIICYTWYNTNSSQWKYSFCWDWYISVKATTTSFVPLYWESVYMYYC